VKEATGAWITTEAAASELGVSVGRVRQLLESGQLPGRRFGRAWVIRRRDLERYRALPPGTKGSPREVRDQRRRPPL
jgi:excisionase family DNA binding protein